MRFIFICLAILFTSTGDLRKRDFPYYSIIGAADIIVEGQMQEKWQIHNNIGYLFDVDGFLKGKISRKTIKVKTFKGWVCDPRDYSKMKKGEKLLLFLTENGNGIYEVINGSRGEIFAETNKVRVDFGYYDYDTFTLGIKEICKHFSYKGPLDVQKADNPTFQRVAGTKNASLEQDNKFYKDFVRYIKSLIVD
ncbi:hypothetical protein M0D21_15435 [Aquimarina sp. D1M17]|uniref:hypothetical protein n=1 Tax=Aquimarina acroporae TaxID=2937283 RepID=UPI0020BDE1BF|nr:hypothetical protein [Aquimarina acroporae]MCK8522969.1 hypothetical protein [Aquimarina acroporae]